MLQRASQTETGETARTATEQAKEQAHSIGSWLGKQVQSHLNQQKDRAADRVQSAAGAVREAKENLDPEQREVVGDYTDMAADQIQRLADYLNEHDVDDFRRQAGTLAQRYPAMFLGSMVLIGLAGGRFLRAGMQAERGNASPDSSGSGQSQSTASGEERPWDKPAEASEAETTTSPLHREQGSPADYQSQPAKPATAYPPELPETRSEGESGPRTEPPPGKEHQIGIQPEEEEPR
jgi:hypothetical protein